MSENSTKKSGSAFMGFLGRNWWKIALGIFAVIALLSVWKTISSTLCKALNDLLGAGDSVINAFQQQMSSCGIGTPSPSTCTGNDDCISGCGRKCTCTSGYCQQCAGDSDCPKGFTCNDKSRCSGGLFAQGCWIGWAAVISGLGVGLIFLLGKVLSRTPKSDVGTKCKEEGIDPVENMDQNNTEANARDKANEMAEDGKTPDGKEFTEDMVDGTVQKAIAKEARANAVENLTKQNQQSGRSKAEIEAAQESITNAAKTDEDAEQKEAEEADKSEGNDDASTENDAADEIADVPVEMGVALFASHMASARNPSHSPRHRARSLLLANRHARRLKRQGMAHLIRHQPQPQPTLDDLALFAPPGKKMYVSNAGIPIMPVTTTCGGADVGTGGPCVQEVECGPECDVICPRPCCRSNTVYDMCWRSPHYGTAVACEKC
jgi:uncharacterized protein YeaC (DUF1315 family)